MKKLFLSIVTKNADGSVIDALSVTPATPDLITSILSLSRENYEITISIKSQELDSEVQ